MNHVFENIKRNKLLAGILMILIFPVIIIKITIFDPVRQIFCRHRKVARYTNGTGICLTCGQLFHSMEMDKLENR